MISSQRQQLILSRLRTRGAVRITALSKELSVSAMTIRRDIAELSDKGLLKEFMVVLLQLTLFFLSLCFR